MKEELQTSEGTLKESMKGLIPLEVERDCGLRNGEEIENLNCGIALE